MFRSLCFYNIIEYSSRQLFCTVQKESMLYMAGCAVAVNGHKLTYILKKCLLVRIFDNIRIHLLEVTSKSPSVFKTLATVVS